MSINSIPEISIIIPTKNGGALLHRVLAAVFDQKTSHCYEVVIVDSGSTDETLSVTKKYPVAVTQIPPAEFSHSKTRNLGASLARASKYYLFLNQDAVPAEDQWLEQMVCSIESQPGLQAVCATELNEQLEVFNVAGVASFVFNNSLARGMYVIEPYLERTWSEMPKPWLRLMFPFSTVCAIFRKEHFDAFPFDETIPWGEDLHWAVHNSRSGYASGCSSFARVYHFHEYSIEQQQDITEKTDALLRNLFGLEFNDVVARMMSEKCAQYMVAFRNAMLEMQRSYSWKIKKRLIPLSELAKRFRK